MKKSAKYFAITLAAATLLSACDKGDSKPTEGAKSSGAEVTQKGETKDNVLTKGTGLKVNEQFKAPKPVTYTMLYSNHENYPYKKDWLFFKKLTEMTNVSLDLTIVNRTDYEDKRSLLISTGEAPQIMPKCYPGQEVQFIASGALLPVSDYKVLLPNFSDKVEKWKMEPDLNQVRQADGKYYVLPGLHEQGGGGYSYMYRKDIYNKLGIHIDQKTYTYQKMFDDMKKVKAAYPDQYVLSDRFSGQSLLNIMATSYGVRAGWGKGSGLKFDWDKEKFYFAPATDKYKKFLSDLAGAIKEGLIDPESFTQTDDAAIAKFTESKSMVMSCNPQTAQDMIKKLNESIGKGKYEIYIMTSPGGPDGMWQMNSSRLENGVIISSKAKDQLGDEGFAQMMNFVDWLFYSDKAQMFCKWGVEGVTYDMVDGKPKLKDDIYYSGINIGAPKQLNVDYGFSNGMFSYGGSVALKTSMYSPFEAEYYERTITQREKMRLDPPIMSTPEENEANNLISTPLMDYVDQMTMKFILGEEDINSGWENYVATLEGLGMQTFVDNCNAIYAKTKDVLAK